jgi:Tol biopolymer transport system component
MKALWSMLGLAVAAVGLSACEPIDDLDLGGGGGAGTAFSRGFVFIREDGNTLRNVYAVDDNGDPNSPLQLTTQGGASHPAVSRNGLVAFVYKSGSTVELRVVPSTGQGSPSTLVANTSTGCPGCNDFRYPTFSPDGRTIVFTVYGGGGGAGRLARVSTDASGFQFLTDATFVYGPASFMPSGTSVLAAGGSDTNFLNTLIEVNMMSGAANPISFNLGNEAQSVVSRIAVSPNGLKVAFDARTSVGTRVFVADVGQTVSNFMQVTQAGSVDSYPSWRGNTELGFLSNAGGGDNIYRISATTVRGTGSFLVPKAMEPAYGGQ